MEYQKIMNLLDDQTTQPSKFRTKIWVEIDDQSNGVFGTNSQIKFKTMILTSSLCGYSDAHILANKTITITGARTITVAARQADETNKGVTFKNGALLTDSISETNNNQIDNAKDLDVVMPMYN